MKKSSSSALNKNLAVQIDDVDTRVDRLDFRVEDLESAVEFLSDEIHALKRDAQREISAMTSPTFMAIFADGIVTRMTTHCSEKNLDLGRGVRLARIAYEARVKHEAPELTAGHFERPANGGSAVILKTYKPAQLNQPHERTNKED
jgi:hypothetical protein